MSSGQRCYTCRGPIFQIYAFSFKTPTHDSKRVRFRASNARYHFVHPLCLCPCNLERACLVMTVLLAVWYALQKEADALRREEAALEARLERERQSIQEAFEREERANKQAAAAEEHKSAQAVADAKKQQKLAEEQARKVCCGRRRVLSQCVLPAAALVFVARQKV